MVESMRRYLENTRLIQLDKLGRYTCLKESGVVIDAGDEISSDEHDEQDGSEGGD